MLVKVLTLGVVITFSIWAYLSTEMSHEWWPNPK